MCVWTSWAHIYEYLILLCKIGCNNLFPQRQALEHYKSPMFYKILLESFMIDALGYKSCLETLDAWNYLIQIYTP